MRLREKDVVFGYDDKAVGGIGVANRVGHYARRNGYSTVMTRDSDVYVLLADRAKIAVRNKADLFVSIHCNSYSDPKANGIEVYVHPNQKNKAHILAATILNEILLEPKCKGLRNRGVKTARFRVLEDTYKTMPSVLVELPFISNPVEAAMLADRYFRDAVSRGIVAGIQKFFI